MLNSATTEIIDGIILEWTQQGRAFTIYEVSREAQERMKAGGMPFIRHKDLHDYYDHCYALQQVLGSEYTQTIIRIPDPVQGLVEPWLYHLGTYDPANYKPIDRSLLVGPSPVPKGPAPNSPLPGMSAIVTLPDGCDTMDDDEKVDKEVFKENVSGEIWIGKDTLESAGFMPSDPIYLFAQGGGIILCPEFPWSDSHKNATLVITRQVEQKGNTRLSRVVRKQLGLDSSGVRADRITWEGKNCLAFYPS